MIGTDAFQETPIVEVCRGITKHHYLVTDVNDIARVMKEAFSHRHDRSPWSGADRHAQGRPDCNLRSSGLRCADELAGLPAVEASRASRSRSSRSLAAIKRAKRPIIYAGGGIIAGDASEELRELVEQDGHPVTTTVMGLGALPSDGPLSLDMLGMHGSVYANYAIDEGDLLIAFGVRFDDRVTGKLEEFAKHGKIVHVDIDPSELNKNKTAHIPIVSDVKYVLDRAEQDRRSTAGDLEPWCDTDRTRGRRQYPFNYDKNSRLASCRSTPSTNCRS